MTNRTPSQNKVTYHPCKGNQSSAPHRKGSPISLEDASIQDGKSGGIKWRILEKKDKQRSKGILSAPSPLLLGMADPCGKC